MRQCEGCGAYLDPEERCDCQEQRVLDKDIVRVMNAVFPGYDQPMHSKVKQPDKYGIMRIPRAEKILNLAFPHEAIKRPVRENAGLFIEMKYGKNKPSPEQQRYLDLLEREGYAVAVCYGCNEAIESITAYLKGAQGGNAP